MRILSSKFRRLLCLAAALFLLSCVPASAAPETPTPSATASDAGESLLIGGEGSGLINILLIGQDGREEESTARADCVILCSFHPDAEKITITSFLRDLYVDIPGYEGNRLNAAYAFGGMPLLQQTMQENFSLSIDGCIEVDFSRFSQIIDVLGGVTIDLRQDEADAINAAVPGSLTEGSHLLTGNQALAYSRIRKLDADGDFSRTERQRRLLSTLLDRYRDAGLLKILSAVVDTLPMISTDLEKKEILLLAAKLFPLLDAPQIVSQRIPADGTYAYSSVRNMEVLTADMDAVRKLLRDSLTVPADSNP